MPQIAGPPARPGFCSGILGLVRACANGWSAAKSTIARCKGREQPSGLTFAPRTKGRTRVVPDRYCGSKTSTSPNFVCQRSFFTLAVHQGLATQVPLRRLDPLVRPTLHGLAAQKPHSSTNRSSAASASPRSPSRFPTAPIVDANLSRNCGWDWQNAQSASSLSAAVAMGPIPSIIEGSAYSPQRRVAPLSRGQIDRPEIGR